MICSELQKLMGSLRTKNENHKEFQVHLYLYAFSLSPSLSLTLSFLPPNNPSPSLLNRTIFYPNPDQATVKTYHCLCALYFYCPRGKLLLAFLPFFFPTHICHLFSFQHIFLCNVSYRNATSTYLWMIQCICTHEQHCRTLYFCLYTVSLYDELSSFCSWSSSGLWIWTLDL